ADVRDAVSNTRSGSEPGLAAYYRFNEGSGDTAFDTTPNHNDAALGAGVTANQPAYVLSTAPFVGVPAASGETATRSYTYDATFNELTSATDEVGRQTLYDIDPANGNVRSVTRVVGPAGGADDVVWPVRYTPQGVAGTLTH